MQGGKGVGKAMKDESKEGRRKGRTGKRKYPLFTATMTFVLTIHPLI